MKKHLNRIAVDLCTPTKERRLTTAKDIRNDVFIKDFRNSEELYEFVLDLMNMFDVGVIDVLGGDETIVNKIDYLISFCTDPGDGSPNIQYCCADGKELDYVVCYGPFADLDFDTIGSQTLVDILLDEHYYDDDGIDDIDENMNADLETDSSTEDADIAGWIAIYSGTRIEIKKSEADSLYSAKKLATLKFKEKFKNVKEHMISIAPGYNDPR